MKVLQFIWKLWRRLQQLSENRPGGIDSHKWESKLEIKRQLSSRCS